MAQYLKYKSWYTGYPVEDDLLQDLPAFVELASNKFLQMKPFNDFLNRALDNTLKGNGLYSCHVIDACLKKKTEVSIMIESRCGILCSECGYKEQMGCKGCVHINSPFWGDSCPVKLCCETKEQEHCGQCGEFPCVLLNQFAYDEKQGDGGKRIGQCKCWAEGR